MLSAKSYVQEPSDSGRIVYCPIRASPLSPMEPRENSLRVTFCAEGAQRANWVPVSVTTAPSGRSRHSGNGSATLVFGCAKLSMSVIIALPFRQPFTEPDMDS